jgi:AraC-like DNA-binding protein
MVPHRPPPGLREHVRRVAGFTERTDGPMFRRELPTASITLILSFGEAIRISSATGDDTFTSFLAGMHEIPVDTEHGGALRCIQVDLCPLGAYRLLGMPMSELTDAVVAPELLAPPSWRDLGERLAALPSWPERFGLLDRALGSRLADGPRPDPEVRWAWGRLARSHGTVPVGALAAEVGWSRRHFAARFRGQVGLTPKPAARVLRFRRALSLITTGRAASISDAAAAAGYADHSHLVREFRRLGGTTPSALLDELPGQ